MEAEFQRLLQAKEARRRQLRELPILEKFEILEKLRERELLLRQFRENQSRAQK